MCPDGVVRDRWGRAMTFSVAEFKKKRLRLNEELRPFTRKILNPGQAAYQPRGH